MLPKYEFDEWDGNLISFSYAFRFAFCTFNHPEKSFSVYETFMRDECAYLMLLWEHRTWDGGIN